MLKNLLPQTTTFLRGPHKLIIYKVMQLEGRGGVNFQIIPFTIDHSSTQMKKRTLKKAIVYPTIFLTIGVFSFMVQE